jgi:hypothetical protein
MSITLWAKVGKAAGIEFPVHPHKLLQACGFYLASSGQDTRAISVLISTRRFSTPCHTRNYRRSDLSILEGTDEGLSESWGVKRLCRVAESRCYA